MGVRASQIVAEVLTGAAYTGFAIQPLPGTPVSRTSQYRGTINVPLFGAPYAMPANNGGFNNSREWATNITSLGAGAGMLTNVKGYLANPFLLSQFSYSTAIAGTGGGLSPLWSSGLMYLNPIINKSVTRLPAPIGGIVNYKSPLRPSVNYSAAGTLIKGMFETLDWVVPAPSFSTPFVTAGGYCIDQSNNSYLDLVYFDTLTKFGLSGIRVQRAWQAPGAWNFEFATMGALGYDPNWVPVGIKGGNGNVYMWLNQSAESAVQTLLDYRLQTWSGIHLDNATLEAAWNNAGTYSKTIKPTTVGWLVSINVNIGLGPITYFIMSYDASKYWILNLYAQGKGVPPINSAAGDAFVDANGIFYFQNTITGQLATSFGEDFPLMPLQLSGYTPAITLPCLDYCPAFDIADMPQL